VLAAADDDQVGVALVGDLEQRLDRLAQLDHVLRLDLAARERLARSLELPSRELLRVRRRGTGSGSGTVPPGATGPATAAGPSSAVGSSAESGAGAYAGPLTLTTMSRTEEASAISAARRSARSAASDPS
jgi:hypothetical protein